MANGEAHFCISPAAASDIDRHPALVTYRDRHVLGDIMPGEINVTASMPLWLLFGVYWICMTQDAAYKPWPT